MKHHTARLYVASATLLVFFLLWVTIAAKPWTSASKRTADPRVLALQARQRALKHEAAHVKAVVASRWHRYEKALRSREREIAAAKRRHDEQVAASRAAYARLAAYRAHGTSRGLLRPDGDDDGRVPHHRGRLGVALARCSRAGPDAPRRCRS